MATAIRRFDQAISAVGRTQAAASTVLIALIVILNAVEIVRRTLADQSFAWMSTLSLLLFVWAVFLGIGAVYVSRGDIRLTYFISKFPIGVRRLARLLGALITSAFLLVIIRYSVDLIAFQLQPDRVLGVPRYTYTLPVILGAATVLLAQVRDFLVLLSPEWSVIIAEDDFDQSGEEELSNYPSPKSGLEA